MNDPTALPSLEQASLTLTATMFDKLPPVLSRALRLIAIPYWYDAHVLAALRGPDDADGRTQKIVDWFSQRSFISTLPGDRYVVRVEARDLIRLRWQADRTGFAEANRRLADYFADRLEKAVGPQADELKQAYVYHLLAADGDQGIRELEQAIVAAEFAHRLAVAEGLVQVADEQRPFLNARHAAWLTYWQARSLQLHNRWADSAVRLQPLLDQPDLAADLQPHVQSSLAAALIETEHWTRAIELYQQALNIFEVSNQSDEAAACQLGLGYAHMDLALNAWGQRESREMSQSTLKQTLANLVTLPVRLPVLLYILVGARETALLPGWLTLAHGIDWTIARLFVRASKWYQLALAHMEATRNATGILRAKDSIARLYLALGYPAGAAKLYQELVDRTDVATSEYQLACARGGLGLCRLRLGQAALAAELLQPAASVLEAYGDTKMAGRVYGYLAEANLLRQAPAEAVAYYAKSTDLLLAAGDTVRATDTAHNLETIAARLQVPDDLRSRLSAQARQHAAGVVKREYQTRYSHPALNVFHQVSVAALAVTLFLTLYLATRTETIIHVNAGTALVAQALSENESSASPSLSSLRAPQVQPQFRANIAMNGLLLSLLGYLVTYTAVGLYVLIRTSPRQIETARPQTVSLEAGALGCGDNRIMFAQATGLLHDDRKFRGRPLPAYSRTMLFGPAGQRITVSGQTRWYSALADEIARRVPPSAPRVNLSLSLSSGAIGNLFIGTLVYLALFIVLGYVALDWLNRPFLGYYSLADLRFVIYLALLIPLIYWLVIAPMRSRLFINPRSRSPWMVAGAGLGLAGVSFLNLGIYHFSLGRPDVIISVLAVWLIWLGVLAIFRARWQPMVHGVPVSQPAFPNGLRQRVLVVAAMISLLAVPLVIREWMGYNALIAGNVERDRAASYTLAQNPDAAQSAGALAVAAYKRALDFNPRDVEAYAGLGALYSQSGEWDWAINAYTSSLQINSRQASMWSGLGLAYEGKAASLHGQWANVKDALRRNANQNQQQENLLNAIAAYTRTVELDAHNPTPLLRRGAARSTLGQLWLDQDKRVQARQVYLEAQQDFTQTLKLDSRPSSAYIGDAYIGDAYIGDAHIGIAWTHFKLGESFYDADNQRYLDADQAKAEYTQALSSFATALRLDGSNLNAQSGLGWTWLKLGDIESKSGNPEQAQAAYEKVLQAFARAYQIAPSDPQVSVSLGNAHWLVSTRLVACRKKDSSPQDLARYEDMIKSAIADIGRGIKLADAQSFALDKGTAYYYREQAQLAFILTACQDQDTLVWYEQAIAFYDQAIAADPSNADYAALRGRIAYAVGLDYPERRADAYQKALTDLSLSLAMRPDNYETLRYRAAVAFDLAGLQPQTAEGLARRESYALISVNDRKRMIELDTSDAARTQDAKLLATSYLRLGFTNYLQGKYPAAIEALDQGLVHNANYSTLYFVKGLAELAAGNETNAQRSYSAGLDVVKKLPQPDRAPFLEDAIQDLDELGQQKPALKATTDNLAQILRAAR